MDKETLSNYGWIVILVLVLSVLLALATPFGLFITDAIKSTTAGLFDVNKNALDIAGIVVPDQEFENVDDGYDHNAPELNPSNTIPTGGYYGNMNLETMEVVWYDEMPATVSENDVYLYGDYFYGFVDPYVGWDVALAVDEMAAIFPAGYETTNKNQTSYDPILESINGKPIVALSYTFNECVNLTELPVIPKNTKCLTGTFGYCTSITDDSLKNFVIPNSVIDMSATFRHCESIVDASIITIPSGVLSLSCAFEDCYSLVKAPVIPQGVVEMAAGFARCTSLLEAPELPSSLKYLNSCFTDCWNMSGIVKVPCGAAYSNGFQYTNATPEYYHIDGCDGSCGK